MKAHMCVNVCIEIRIVSLNYFSNRKKVEFVKQLVNDYDVVMCHELYLFEEDYYNF